MAKTTIYIALAIGAEEPAYPAYVAFRSPFRFVSGSLVVLPEPSPVALASDGTGTVAVDPGIWLVDEILPTQVFRRAVVVPEATGIVNYSTLVEVTSPIELGYGPSWAALAQQAALAAALSRDEVLAALAALGKGEPGGVASLDDNGQVPEDQMPTRLSPASIYAIVGQQIDDRDIPSMITEALAAAGTVEAAAVTAINNAAAGLNLVLSTDPRIPQIVTAGVDNFASVTVDQLGRIAFAVLNNGTVQIPHLESDAVTVGSLDVDDISLAGKTFRRDGYGDSYSYVLTDEANRIAENALDQRGRVPAWVLRAWLDRFDAEVMSSRLSLQPAPLGAAAIALSDGTIRLVESRLDLIMTDGDSITQGVGDEENLGGWPGRLATLSGKTVQNIGLAARASSDLALRQGGLVPLITVTGGQIPASGPVAVTEILPKTSWRYNSSGGGSFDFAGTLGGVPGTLRHWQTGTTPEGNWDFLRSAAGAAVPLSPRTPFIASSPAANYLDALYITAPGRNNLGSTNTPMDMIRDAQAQIAHLSPLRPRFLVLSILTASSELNTTSGYASIMAANARASEIFGSRFVDVRRYMIDHGLASLGITPTPADVTAIAGDTIPPSLLSDGLHPNAKGYTVMANYIQSILQAKGWA